MKIRIERDQIADAVAWVLRSVGSKATLPVLGGILVEASDGKISFSGTDLEIAGRAEIEGAVEQSGRAVLPGRLLNDILRSLPEGSVTIEADAAQGKITGGAAEFTLRALPHEDFPAFQGLDAAVAGVLDAKQFLQAVGQVVRAASHDEARPILTGVLIEIADGKITLAATDSYRLSVRELPWSGPSEPIRRVVPARALAEAARAADAESEVKLSLGESQAGVEAGGRRLTTRLIEGEFPNWRQLVPEDQPNKLTIDRETFAESVRRVGILAQQGVPVRLELGEGGVKLTAGTQDLGDAVEHVAASYAGQPNLVAFNPTYLSEGIAAIEGAEVVLGVRDGLKPAVMRAPGDESFLYLLMPVRVS
ncbi:MAG: DNA polymerase III subunit beta [Actinomycetota bacterium]|nr:DNA polymerase III subunit beta [Actinomycetota bacterium]